MKTLNHLKTSGTILVLFIISLSCSTSNKMAVLCPELPRNNLNNQVAQMNRNNVKTYAYSQRQSNGRKSGSNHSMTAKSNLKRQPTKKSEINKPTTDKNISQFEEVSDLNRIEYKTSLLASSDNTNIPLLKTYSITIPNTETEIDINDSEGNNIGNTATKSTIYSDKTVIKTSKKSKGSFTSNEKNSIQQESTTKKVEGLGLAGMIVGLVGFFFAGIPFGIIAIIFGAISLAKFKKNPDKFSGKGFAIASLVIGLVVLVLTIAILV